MAHRWQSSVTVIWLSSCRKIPIRDLFEVKDTKRNTWYEQSAQNSYIRTCTKLINNHFLDDGFLQTRPPVSVQLGKTNFTIPEVFRYKNKEIGIKWKIEWSHTDCRIQFNKKALDIQRLIKSEYSWIFFRVPDCIGYCLAGNWLTITLDDKLDHISIMTLNWRNHK